MNTSKKNARIVGILFILGFAGIITTIFVKPIIDAPNYLVQLTVHKNQVMIGALFQAIMSFAVAGIAIWLYPVLRRHNEALALGSVGFRIIESMLQFVATLGLLSLLALSQEYVKAGAPTAPHFQTLGALLLAVNDWAFNVLSQIAFILGALMYYYIFYQSKLIPRWLSSWGIIAITLHLTAVILTIFAFINPFSTVQVVLALPIAAQEMVLAVWLIAKGFNPSAIASESVKM